jgi:hypothetical protein
MLSGLFPLMNACVARCRLQIPTLYNPMTPEFNLIVKTPVIISQTPLGISITKTRLRGHLWKYSLLRMASSGTLRRVALVRIDVSGELSASFIRVTRIDELGTTLAVTRNRRTQRKSPCYPDEGGSKFLRNVGSYKSHTA